MTGQPTDPRVMKGRFVMDCDGDVWQRLSGGALWRCLTTDSVDTYGSDLLNVCGPLEDLWPVRAAQQEALLEAAKAADSPAAVRDGFYSEPAARWLRARAAALSVPSVREHPEGAS